ncbi:hypothetical protein [Swaminathania salitolerans]|uniref:Uncharacterized protein n=1 Tax=Swaminathania salitolerans TaxID=182838 RepID=A0A511BKH6_9PROT|nr:hypothetical protein [Swaminathania salitolerans]GBQ09722.1 hypothetical protein AA21291_0173 [Swaminathania salitolerans LMG 21291]GEL00870.1 hypothetical protein SSA02_00330 [Swaminathania salitolerans]
MGLAFERGGAIPSSAWPRMAAFPEPSPDQSLRAGGAWIDEIAWPQYPNLSVGVI